MCDDSIECEVSTTRCVPLSQQLLRHMAPDELQECARALQICGPGLSRLELARAVAAAILAARGKGCD